MSIGTELAAPRNENVSQPIYKHTKAQPNNTTLKSLKEPADTMSAILSGFVFQNIFSSNSKVDDGFWQEPSTMKTKPTAAACHDAKAGTCSTTGAAALTTKPSQPTGQTLGEIPNPTQLNPT